MLPTPSTSHVNINRIYEPAEDSFFLLDALSAPSETAFLTARYSSITSPPLVVEVGTGSGVVLAFVNVHARTIFGREDVLTLGVDVNGDACAATGQTVRRAIEGDGGNVGGIFLGVVQGDLTAALRPGVVDVLVFNPPYVPTDELPSTLMAAPRDASMKLSKSEILDEDTYLLSLSYAGGLDGMEVTYRLLDQLPNVLSLERGGVAYLLLCEQNKPEEFMERVRRWGAGWHIETVRRSGKIGGWERLQIVRILRRVEAETDEVWLHFHANLGAIVSRHTGLPLEHARYLTARVLRLDVASILNHLVQSAPVPAVLAFTLWHMYRSALLRGSPHLFCKKRAVSDSLKPSSATSSTTPKSTSASATTSTSRSTPSPTCSPIGGFLPSFILGFWRVVDQESIKR